MFSITTGALLHHIQDDFDMVFTTHLTSSTLITTTVTDSSPFDIKVYDLTTSSHPKTTQSIPTSIHPRITCLSSDTFVVDNLDRYYMYTITTDAQGRRFNSVCIRSIRTGRNLATFPISEINERVAALKSWRYGFGIFADTVSGRIHVFETTIPALNRRVGPEVEEEFSPLLSVTEVKDLRALRCTSWNVGTPHRRRKSLVFSAFDEFDIFNPAPVQYLQTCQWGFVLCKYPLSQCWVLSISGDNREPATMHGDEARSLKIEIPLKSYSRGNSPGAASTTPIGAPQKPKNMWRRFLAS